MLLKKKTHQWLRKNIRILFFEKGCGPLAEDPVLSVSGPPATRKMGLLCLVTASSAAAAKRCIWSHTLWWKAAEEEEEHSLELH